MADLKSNLTSLDLNLTKKQHFLWGPGFGPHKERSVLTMSYVLQYSKYKATHTQFISTHAVYFYTHWVYSDGFELKSYT